MSFTPNIPASGQSLGNSRPQILNNFAILRSTLAVNHNDVNASGNGKHKFLQMPAQGSAPTTAANEMGLYCRTVTGAATALFFRDQSNGTNFQLTGGAVFATTGATFLANGFVLNWGISAVNPNPATTAINFTVPYQLAGVPTNAYSVTITSIRNSSNVDTVYLVSVSPTDFVCRNTSSGGIAQISWMAIGPRTEP
jgi:hypothetical protein